MSKLSDLVTQGASEFRKVPGNLCTVDEYGGLAVNTLSAQTLHEIELSMGYTSNIFAIAIFTGMGGTRNRVNFHNQN